MYIYIYIYKTDINFELLNKRYTLKEYLSISFVRD